MAEQNSPLPHSGKLPFRLGELFGRWRRSALFGVQLEWWLLTGCLCALGLFLAHHRLLLPLDYGWYDAMVAQRPAPHSSECVLIYLESDRLHQADLNRRQWRLSDTAELIDLLAKSETKATILNIDLTAHQPFDKQGEKALSQAIRQHGRVLLPITISTSAQGELNFRVPINAYANPAAGLGHNHLLPLVDGIVRQVPLTVHNDQIRWPHLALIALSGQGQPEITQTATRYEVDQTQDSHVHYVRFLRAGQHFTTLGSREIFNGEVPADFFRGKYVLIDFIDYHPKLRPPSLFAASQALSQLDILANTLNSLNSKVEIKPLAAWQQDSLTVLVILLVLLAFYYVAPRHYLWLTLAAIVLTALCSWLLFYYVDRWFAIASPVLMTLVAYPCWAWRRFEVIERYLRDERKNLQEQHLWPLTQRGSTHSVIDQELDWVRSANAKLLHAKQFIQAIVNELPIGIVLANPNGVITLVNRQGLNALGLADEASLLGGGWPQCLARFSGQTPALTLGDSVARQSSELTDSQGRSYWASYHRLADSDERDLGVILTLTDISTLKHEVAQRQELLRFVSHDLRSPLASILAVIHMRQEQPGRHSDDDRFVSVNQYAQQAITLAQEFLYLAQADDLDQERFALVDLSEALEQALHLVVPLAEEKSIRLASQVTASALTFGNHSLLERVLLNLLHNAVKFSPSERCIEVSLTRIDDQWVVCIRNDNVPSECMDTSARLPTSIALGLQFVGKVVAKHQGRFVLNRRESACEAKVWLKRYDDDLL